MKVTLISYTPNPEALCGKAALVSTSESLDSNKPSDAIASAGEAKAKNTLERVMGYGHESVAEHANFTFLAEGISRACSHQLVRHRIASFTQQSQRYVKFSELGYVIPHTIEEKPKLKERYEKFMKMLSDEYNSLVKDGIPAEDARYLYPNASKTNLVVTMNARALKHFFELRCCNRAQWEIHELADLMLTEAKKAAPLLFAKAGPSCIKLGYCPEGKLTCGKIDDVKKKYAK